MTHLSPAEALQEIQRFLKDKTDAVPEGFYSVKQMAIQWNKSNSRTGKLLAQAVEDGLAEIAMFKINVGYTNRLTPHYRFMNKK